MTQDRDRWIWGWSTHGRADLPLQLQAAPDLTNEFENNRCPYNRLAREAMANTEAENRRANGEGSWMVTMDRPFPELRPKNDNAKHVLRASFNQRWKQEQARAESKGMDAFDRINQQKAQREALQHTEQGQQRSMGLER